MYMPAMRTPTKKEHFLKNWYHKTMAKRIRTIARHFSLMKVESINFTLAREQMRGRRSLSNHLLFPNFSRIYLINKTNLAKTKNLPQI